MTSAATARIWFAAGGVALGILCSHHRLPTRGSVALVALGLASVVIPRRRMAVLAGIALVAAGLASVRSIPVTDPTVWGGAPASAYRDSLGAALAAAPERSGALLAGLTIGDTSGIDYWTMETFRRSGLAHLVAVSGSNVAMVLAAMAVATVRLPLVVRGIFGALALGMYVAVVGPDPSVLRAAGMGVVGLVAYVYGRDAASLNSLGMAVAAVLALRPDLLFAVGLHLSAAATLGIVVWARAIEERLHRVPALLRAPIAITLAAQIAVAPLLIVIFERFSVVAPMANVLAAPAVPPATLIGLSSGIAGLVSTEAGRGLATLAAPFAEWILWVSDETGAWSWASVDVASIWGWILAVPVGTAILAAAAGHREIV